MNWLRNLIAEWRSRRRIQRRLREFASPEPMDYVRMARQLRESSARLRKIAEESRAEDRWLGRGW